MKLLSAAGRRGLSGFNPLLSPYFLHRRLAPPGLLNDFFTVYKEFSGAWHG